MARRAAKSKEQAGRLIAISSLVSVLVGLQGCAASAPRETQPNTAPVRSVCRRELRADRDTLTTLAHAVRRIANSSNTSEGKVQELRQTLPNHDGFLGLYSDLCSLAAVGQIADSEYHGLLDDVLPLVFLGSDAGASGSPLAAPHLLQPVDNALFDHYPRTTTLQWVPVQGATRYLVEVEILMFRGPWQPQAGLPPNVTEATEFVFDFDGAQTGRWRVRALDGAGLPGPASAWRRFTYL